MNGFLNIPRKVVMNYSALEEKIWFGKGCKKQRREVRNTHRLLASKKVKLQKRNTKGRFLNSYGVGTHTHFVIEFISISDKVVFSISA